MADTPANDTAFGRPGHSRGDCAGYPQLRLLGLAECGTHAITAVAMGGYGTAVPMLASELIDQGAWARGSCCWPAASDVPLRRITVQARSADLVVPLATTAARAGRPQRRRWSWHRDLR